MRNPRAHPKRRRRRAQQGFSLIEVVVAMGVFALIAGVLFGALWAGRGQLERLQASGGEQEQMLGLRRVLSGLIETATVAQAPRGEPVFTGTGQLAAFNATPADRGQAGALYRIELAIEHETRGSSLFSRLTLLRRPLASAATDVEVSELIKRPGALAFEYTANPGPYSQAQPAEWTQTWADPSKLPARVQVVDANGPVLSIAVQQSKDPRCILRRGTKMLAGGECQVR